MSSSDSSLLMGTKPTHERKEGEGRGAMLIKSRFKVTKNECRWRMPRDIKSTTSGARDIVATTFATTVAVVVVSRGFSRLRGQNNSIRPHGLAARSSFVVPSFRYIHNNCPTIDACVHFPTSTPAPQRSMPSHDNKSKATSSLLLLEKLRLAALSWLLERRLKPRLASGFRALLARVFGAYGTPTR